MTKNVIDLFAAKPDIEVLLQSVEATRSIKYSRSGLFEKPHETVFNSWKEIPNLGVASIGDFNHEPCYLVTDIDVEVVIRRVPQRKGGVRYAIDQAENPHTIVFRPGGLHEKSGCLISGQIGTISFDPISIELFNLFSRSVRNQFSRIKSHFVGVTAARLLDEGTRLTSNIKSPKLYDLKSD